MIFCAHWEEETCAWMVARSCEKEQQQWEGVFALQYGARMMMMRTNPFDDGAALRAAASSQAVVLCCLEVVLRDAGKAGCSRHFECNSQCNFPQRSQFRITNMAQASTLCEKQRSIFRHVNP